jgi:hypothetical protein
MRIMRMRYSHSVFVSFLHDTQAAIGLIAAIALPVVIGSAVLGTEAGLWAYKRQSMQGAADAAALSAVISNTTGDALRLQGKSVAAAQGFADGINGVSVTINTPPLSGTYTGRTGAVETIILQPQQPAIAQFFSSATINIRARAVAIQNRAGACLLALNTSSKGAITLQGTSAVSLSGCDAVSNSADKEAIYVGGASRLTLASASAVGGITNVNNISAQNGIWNGAIAAPDPYADRSFPNYAGCTQAYKGGNATLQPGVYCGGISLSAGAKVTLQPGIYYLDRSDLKIAGNASLSGTGVTLVFTSSTGRNYGSASISSNAVVNLSAPNSGPTAGIVLFGDRGMPKGTSFKINGGGTQQWTGAIYLPKAELTYAGGATGGSGCTQIIADTINFTGNSNLSLSCEGTGTSPMGNQVATLVE